MKILLLIPSFIIFLFTLHKLIKDDHVFLRRNVKVEQVFDIAFFVILIDIVLGQLKYIPESLYLNNVISVAVVILYLFGKYKKLPLGRLYDFFTLSFLNTLPFIFFVNSFFSNKNQKIYFISGTIFYIFVSLFFLRSLFRKLTNRSLKEGNITIYFLIIYSTFTLIYSILISLATHVEFVTTENLYILLQFFFSLIFIIKQKFLTH